MASTYGGVPNPDTLLVGHARRQYTDGQAPRSYCKVLSLATLLSVALVGVAHYLPQHYSSGESLRQEILGSEEGLDALQAMEDDGAGNPIRVPWASGDEASDDDDDTSAAAVESTVADSTDDRPLSDDLSIAIGSTRSNDDAPADDDLSMAIGSTRSNDDAPADDDLSMAIGSVGGKGGASIVVDDDANSGTHPAVNTNGGGASPSSKKRSRSSGSSIGGKGGASIVVDDDANSGTHPAVGSAGGATMDYA